MLQLLSVHRMFNRFTEEEQIVDRIHQPQSKLVFSKGYSYLGQIEARGGGLLYIEGFTSA